MKRRFLIAGNWKMNAGPKEAKSIIEGLQAEHTRLPETVDVLFCPPYISLSAVSAYADYVSFGAQDVHFEDNGAFTGAISTSMLTEMGVSACIIGHSERRQYFGETDHTVNLKVKKLLQASITPIICCGESLDQRKSIDFEAFVASQIKAALEGISAQDAKKTVIAYEPIWAIGTGETASPEQAQSMHLNLRNTLSELYDAETAASIRILYGGSMKAANAEELLGQADVDGGLIGGASLKADEFASVIRTAATLA